MVNYMVTHVYPLKVKTKSGKLLLCENLALRRETFIAINSLERILIAQNIKNYCICFKQAMYW